MLRCLVPFHESSSRRFGLPRDVSITMFSGFGADLAQVGAGYLESIDLAGRFW